MRQSQQPNNIDELKALIVEQQREITSLRKHLANLTKPTDSDNNNNNSKNIKSSVLSTSLGESNSSTNSDDENRGKDETEKTACFVNQERKSNVVERLLEKRGTSEKDVRTVRELCYKVCGDHGEECVEYFYEAVENWKSSKWDERNIKLNEKWYEEPWYCIYIQYWGTENDSGKDRDGDDDDGGGGCCFETARNMLEYLEKLGFKNLCVLSHYESPDGDEGYDVSEYVPRKTWGGEKEWEKFLDEANERNIRVVTDGIYNHTSTKHEWFQRAINGEEKYINYYIQRNGREKIAEYDRNGDIICKYRDPDGTITERVVIFPNIDRTHGLWVEINGKCYQFYRTFYPFQVDLNLQNPKVLKEIFNHLGKEFKQGILGKRFDAIAHWIIQPGTCSEGLEETHALEHLFKIFIRHMSCRAIIIPEVVNCMNIVSQYAGVETNILNHKCSSEGDAILSFEMQAAFREMIYFQTVAPFWQKIFRTVQLPYHSTWINVLEHHDETFMGFFHPEIRHWITEYIQSRGAAVYRNGLSAGCRYTNCLDHDPERISTALFILYTCPGAPFVYFGLEIGWKNNYCHAKNQMIRSKKIFESLGFFATANACYDPRHLQRGPIPRSAFLSAMSKKYLPWITLQKLNELRRRRKSLRSRNVHPIDSGDIGILCLVRYDDGERMRNEANAKEKGTKDEDKEDNVLLCVANLTPFEKTLLMPVWQVSQRLKIKCDETRVSLRLRDLLSGRIFKSMKEDTNFSMKLERFGRYMMEVDEKEM